MTDCLNCGKELDQSEVDPLCQRCAGAQRSSLTTLDTIIAAVLWAGIIVLAVLI